MYGGSELSNAQHLSSTASSPCGLRGYGAGDTSQFQRSVNETWGRGEGGGGRGGIEKLKTPKCLVLHKTELSRDIC